MHEVIKTYTYILPDGPQVFRFVTPSEAVYDRFEDERARGSLSAARSNLVKSCVRSHTGIQLDAIFEQYPAVKHGLALAIQKEAGAMLDIVEGEAPAS